MARKKGMLGYRKLLNTKGFKLTFTSYIKDTFFIVSGIFAAAFGLESFLLPNRFIDGGATGISLLISEVAEIPLWLLIIMVNLPFLFMAYRVIGKQFAIKAVLAIFGLALTLVLVNFPEVTQDKLLVAVFGGFFLGAGIGLSIRGGSVLDGTEVLAIFLSRKWGAKIGDIIILMNVVIFLAAAYLLSIEAALYSMLTYLAASKTLDFVVEGIEEYTGVTIISQKSEEMRTMVIEKMGRGLTIYQARGGYGKKGEQMEYDVIYTVITRLEIRKLHLEIEKIDEKAFVIMNSINDTKGGMVKKRILNH
ncbi:YitT family protein [Flagellimonas allohymeniacidonis]|uniref:YitT family protein n=1 Tax=Flagellimonas allohymeniacidonis TaxID=2517819 RepID=A0A4Q8QE92_9FLAO|nr:YitT family protein [Allomuricauda hymeniacidonis]TAI47927.1 YitT family protein [Allomuricauda hymeniacidonis]